jgi:hypothetical protein
MYTIQSWSYCHSTNGFSPDKQRRKCIDHALESIKIAQAVTLLRYEDYSTEYYSDHTPMLGRLYLYLYKYN